METAAAASEEQAPAGSVDVVPDELARSTERIRAAEVIASLSLATDLSLSLPFEHGLESTLLAMRLGDSLGIEAEVASQTYFGCLLFHVGCTADAEVAADVFGHDAALLNEFLPVMFGARPEMMVGVMRALAKPEDAALRRAGQMVRGLPRAARGHKQHLASACEVAQMLSERLGVPPEVRSLFSYLAERWDGRGEPGAVGGDELPLPVRIVHVARDAAFQCMLGGEERASRVVRRRAGGAFDPTIATRLADEVTAMLARETEGSVWDQVLAAEPAPHLYLEGDAIDRALAAMGDFADLASPYLVGHSAGVAELAAAAARRGSLEPGDTTAVRRAAFVHDVGRVAVPVRIWQKPAPLTADDREQVRLHAYQSERILAPSPFLRRLGAVATSHHERLDGSGYHRGTAAAGLTPAARLLAAADTFHAMTEPRPHRPALAPQQAVDMVTREAEAGRLDVDSVAAVLATAGHRGPRLERPSGLTEREAEVVGLLARGLQTKQIGRALGISAKTADRHIQNAYAKIGVSTRAAAAVFAMQHGLAAWGELPMGPGPAPP